MTTTERLAIEAKMARLRNVYLCTRNAAKLSVIRRQLEELGAQLEDGQ